MFAYFQKKKAFINRGMDIVQNFYHRLFNITEYGENCWTTS